MDAPVSLIRCTSQGKQSVSMHRSVAGAHREGRAYCDTDAQTGEKRVWIEIHAPNAPPEPWALVRYVSDGGAHLRYARLAPTVERVCEVADTHAQAPL